MTRNLEGKVAWVTGAGTGIGAGAAMALAGLGMKVALSGRRREKLEEVAAQLPAPPLMPAPPLIEPLDVADREAVFGAVERIESQAGRIDTAVLSAGINVKRRNWHDVSVADWERVIRVDLDGAFYCVKAVLPSMVRQGGGLIVNISSWAGRQVSMVTGPAYTAAKHAMNAMNESINMEAGRHGVRACAICPGEVATPILDNRPIPVSAADRARMVQAEDCGAIVAFLAQLPPHVCINELTVSPTWNRGYVAQAERLLGD